MLDTVTHIALGANLGALVLGRKLGKRAMGWGILFGVLPDLDVILMPFVDTMWDLHIHRGASHSVVIAVLLAWFLAKPLARHWQLGEKGRWVAGGFVLLSLLVHILVDVFTIYGTQVWWPFSTKPVAVGNLFIIDPLFLLPLLVASLWVIWLPREDWMEEPARSSGRRTKAKPMKSQRAQTRQGNPTTQAKKVPWKKSSSKKPERKRRHPRRLAAICLALAAAYIGLSLWAQHAVAQRFRDELAQRGITWQRRMESPTPFNILLWRAVFEREEEFWVGYRSLLDGEEPVRWTIYPKEAGTLERWSQRKETREVRRFSDNWCLARDSSRGVWLVDMRFGEFRKWDEKGVALRPMFAWELRTESRDDPMKGTAPEERNVQETLRQMWFRMWGNDQVWDDRPRLVGNPGRLQEYLGSVK